MYNLKKNYFTCKGCELNNFKFGTHFKCEQCPDFHLCPTCHDRLARHQHQHRFWRFQVGQNFMSINTYNTLHPSISICNDCNSNPIVGTRWRCKQCSDYTLCSDCYHAGSHQKSGHLFLCITNSFLEDDFFIGRKNKFCDWCHKSLVIGTRFNCQKCPRFNLCSLCHNHAGKHDSSGHRFWCITTTTTATAATNDNNNISNINNSNNGSLRLLEARLADQSGPSENIVVHDSEALFADNDNVKVFLKMSYKLYEHYDVICKICKKMPIGTCWKCADCVDFDLCSSCRDQLDNRHGHRFWRIQNLEHKIKLCLHKFKPIRTKHPVICDECRRFPIAGFRWQCIQCIDFDLCSECYHDGKHNTPGHEFCCTTSTNERSPTDENRVRHYRVRCYNCSESPIIGTRWKCSQCADFDLCPWCYNLGSDQHQHRYNFWRIESSKYLTLIIANDLQTRHAVICSVCNRNPILGIRWNCKECTDFNLCSKCYHNNKHSFDKFGHRFWCIITSNFSNSNVSQTLMRSNLSLLAPESGPSENAMIGDSASSADNDSPTTMETTTNRRENIANTGDDYRSELKNNRNALQSNADSDQIQSSNLINLNASQASTNTNSISIGTRVKIKLDLKTLWLLQLARGFDLSRESLMDCMIHVGTVTQIKENGSVLVQYAHTGRQFTINPALLTRLPDQSGPSENIVIRDLKASSFADKDTPIATTSKREEIIQNHLADHDSDQIESTNSNNSNESQASIDTNLICVGTRVVIELGFDTVLLIQQESGCDWSAVTLMDCMEHVGTVTQIKENGNVLVRYEHTGQQWLFNPVVLTRLADQSGASENIVVPDSEALLANNDTPIATTSRPTIRQSHIADHDSDQIESTNSNNSNASQASIDTNLICVGSRVKIELDLETVLLLQRALGCVLSRESLMDCMEHVGTVTQIKENGNVLVRYEHSGRQWPFNPVVLSRLADQSGPSENTVVYDSEALFADNDTPIATTPSRAIRQSHIADHDSDPIESTNSNNFNASQASTDANLNCVGRRVKIELDLETVQLLQQASGCDWSYESLKDYMEGIGTVTHINENGNAVVRYAHIERSLICNPVVLTMFVDQSEPSENIVVYNLEALFADNVSLPSTESERNHIANIDENEHNRIVSAKNSEVAQYKVQLAEVQQELERMKDEATCPVCIEVRKNIIFQCGHGVCNECNDRLQGTTCPICRKQIQQRIPFY